MNLKDKIKAEIERRKNNAETLRERNICIDILAFLDTLEEKSEILTNLDLEKKALNFGEEIGVPVSENFMKIARHFYELGLNGRKAK